MAKKTLVANANSNLFSIIRIADNFYTELCRGSFYLYSFLKYLLKISLNIKFNNYTDSNWNFEKIK